MSIQDIFIFGFGLIVTLIYPGPYLLLAGYEVDEEDEVQKLMIFTRLWKQKVVLLSSLEELRFRYSTKGAV